MKQKSWKIFLLKLTILFIAAVGLISPAFFEVSAQKGKKVQSSKKSYNRFEHDTAAHSKQSCSQCHKSPTGVSTAETVDKESYKYPDITDYPDHDSCVECHRQQFFKGTRPPICSVCHTKVSPRDKARFAFPVPNQPQEFTIRFPHNVHQDIIAQKNVASAHFTNAKFSIDEHFRGESVRKNKKSEYNNCTICHSPAKAKIYDTVPRRPQLVALETGLVMASHREKLTVPAGYFKTRPSGHDSCFNCHYSEQKPTRSDCAGCHILRNNPLVESNVIERLILNFNHESRDEHVMECTSCHLRITQSANLKTLEPDVPIFTCAGKGTGCHATVIKLEVDRRVEDLVKRQTNPQHQIQGCAKCHNNYIGSYQVPESHKVIKP